jgi:cephalosporin-C deacetylase
MPVLDMPLHELKRYKGRNPCPPDMDSFWERALAEMKSTDSKVALEPHPFPAPGAECFDLWFAGVRGARIHAQYLKPKAVKGRHPAVIQFHGYCGNAGDWSDKLKWTSLGFSVAAMDCRGQGGLSEDPGGVKGTTMRGHIIRGLEDGPDNLLFRHIFLDAAELARIVMDMPEVDPDRVGCTGGSQGGGLTLACAALEPGIARAFAVYPFLCDYLRVWEMDLAKNAYEELAYWFRQFDPLHERENEIFTRLGYIDVQHLAKRIKAEVRVAVGLMDDVCPPSSQFAAYNRIKSGKDVLIYPDYRHEGIPFLGDEIHGFLGKL